jgi:hypothetical protein
MRVVGGCVGVRLACYGVIWGCVGVMFGCCGGATCTRVVISWIVGRCVYELYSLINFENDVNSILKNRFES